MKTLFTAFAALTLSASPASAAEIDPGNWDLVVEKASGQTVYWNAWGGSESINDYIGWVGEELREQFGRQACACEA